MAETLTTPQFLDLLQQSQLLSTTVYAQMQEQLPALGALADDAERLAKALVKSQLLTIYQASRLLEGHASGYYVGKYKLLEILGQGGMGMVFLAENTTMKRLVALKVIHRATDDGHILARFKREARSAAALSHPNIVQTYDFDEVDGLPFISMEYVEGMDLDRVVRKQGKLPVGQVADLLRQAALGLEHARAAGLVHRDIKPANLLVATDGTVKLLDLGLAANTHDRKKDSLTGRLDQVGTVDFMAPEQALDSRNVDTRADLYSLGCVAYFVLTGQLPCDGNSTAEKLLKHQSIDPAPVRSLNSDVPEELAVVVHKLLAKRPDNRYATPAEAAAALAPFAQAVSPPYDVSLVKFPRAAYLPLLGRGPEPGEIAVRAQLSGITALTRPGDTTRLAGGSQPAPSTSVPPARSVAKLPGPAVSKAGPPARVAKSGVVVGEKRRSALSQVVTRDEDEAWLDEALAPLPSTGKKKTRGKKGKAERSDGLLVAIFGGGVAVVALVVGLILFLGRPGTTPETTPSGTTVTTQKPVLPDVVGPPFERWQAEADRWKRDPDVVLYYTFNGPNDKGDVVTSQAQQPKFGALNGKIMGGAKLVPGRFSQKPALEFRGKGSNQYITLSDGDSKMLNFRSPFSVAVWFKVKTFDTNFNTLICKGDNAWRLQRWQTKDLMELAANNATPSAPGATSKSPGLVFTSSVTPVNDAKWHHVVAVFEQKGDDALMHLYLDGAHEGVAKTAMPQENTHPVWIGGNAQHAKGDPRIWNGLIDEVLIVNRALTRDDVERMYAAGKP